MFIFLLLMRGDLGCKLVFKLFFGEDFHNFIGGFQNFCLLCKKFVLFFFVAAFDDDKCANCNSTGNQPRNCIEKRCVFRCGC